MAPPRKPDTQRLFNPRQRAALLERAKGKCQACNESLEKRWHADHILPWAQGGETVLANGRALCPACSHWRRTHPDDVPRPHDYVVKPYAGRKNGPGTRKANGLRPGPKPLTIEIVLDMLDRMSDGCWIWRGPLRHDGYAVIRLNGHYPIRVHRAVYEHLRGAIPSGLVLHHLCKNRACANPDHLTPETIPGNIRKDHPDLWGKWQREKTHCKRGHSLSGENLHVNNEGRRHCRICLRMIQKRHRDKKRSERGL